MKKCVMKGKLKFNATAKKQNKQTNKKSKSRNIFKIKPILKWNRIFGKENNLNIVLLRTYVLRKPKKIEKAIY